MTDIWLDMNVCNLNFPSLCLFIEPGDCDREARAGDRRGASSPWQLQLGSSCSCVSWLMCRLVTWCLLPPVSHNVAMCFLFFTSPK